MKKNLLQTVAISAAVLLLGVISASANPITFSDSFGSYAKFDVESGNLQITLWTDRNSTVNSEVLTALFFDISGISSLTRNSATVPIVSASGGTNSFVYEGTHWGLTTPLDVGGEWAYKSSLSLPGLGSQGIGTAGLDGTFGASDLFPGPDLNSKQAPDGGDFGLIGLASPGVAGAGYDVLVRNTTVFLLSGLPTGFDPEASVQNVSFQYGTSLTQVPEPATLLFLGAGLIGLTAYGKRKFLKK